MNLNTLAKEINENAVAHGWWEGERSDAEIRALIHSEWSEALEEYRASRPMVWYAVNGDCQMCGNRPVMYREICEGYTCKENHKPEGIAVELADGCIRILDFLAHVGVTLPDEIATIGDFMEYCKKNIKKAKAAEHFDEYPLPELIDDLHFYTAESIFPEYGSTSLVEAVGLAFLWIRDHGLNPAQIMQEKHEYNKSRSYKHGGKVC